MTRDQVKKIVRLVETVVSKKLNESASKEEILKFANKNLVTVSTPKKYTDYKPTKVDVFNLTLLNTKTINNDKISVYSSKGSEDYIEINDKICKLI